MKRLMLTLLAFVVLFPAQQANAQEKAVALQSYNFGKYYVGQADGLGKMSEIGSILDRQATSYFVVPGLADREGVSFRSANDPNAYFRHQEGRLKLHALEDDDLFRQDATFKVVDGLASGSWKSFESVNYPGCFLRHKSGELWVERNDDSSLFAGDATFRIVAPPALPPAQTQQGIAQKGFSLARPSYADVTQGDAGTCWVLSSIAEVQYRGIDLTKRIRYEGNNNYLVTLYNYNRPASRPAGGMHAETVRVYFDGKTTGVDAVFNPNNPHSAWVVIMQRAVIQAVHDWDATQVIDNPHGGWGGDALSILTGRPAPYIHIRDGNAQQIVKGAISARKTVVMGTLGSATTLVSNHDYAVLGFNAQGLILYDPHGSRLNVSWDLVNQEGEGFFIQ